jgi:hypothetical protein
VKSTPLWRQFLVRFENPLIIILLIASGVSALTGGLASFFVIVVIVMISVFFDFVQDVRAQNAVASLRASVAVQAAVRRDGKVVSLPISQLVPGDIVELVAGDLIPADSRLLESRDGFVAAADILHGRLWHEHDRHALSTECLRILDSLRTYGCVGGWNAGDAEAHPANLTASLKRLQCSMLVSLAGSLRSPQDCRRPFRPQRRHDRVPVRVRSSAIAALRRRAPAPGANAYVDRRIVRHDHLLDARGFLLACAEHSSSNDSRDVIWKSVCCLISSFRL